GGATGIYGYRSSDGGQTYQGPFLIKTGASLFGSVPAFGPKGELYVAWSIGAPLQSGIGFARSFDGGQTSEACTQIAPVGSLTLPGTDRSPSFPHLAVDRTGGPNHGNIYLTYYSAHLGGGTGADALFMRSTDGGSTWSTPSRINDDDSSAPQWYPTVDVDTSGNVHSFFYDRRDNTGTVTDLYYARSTDGGLTWEPNVPVTDTAFTMTTFAEGSPAWGDYINATTDGKTALVAYADGRNGTPDAFFARIVNR